MIWDRDYMKWRSEVDPNAPENTNTGHPAPDPADIFAGVPQQPLRSPAPTASASDDRNTQNVTPTLRPSTPPIKSQPELPLNRLMAKYPRFFWYAAIAILGIIIGILLGRKL